MVTRRHSATRMTLGLRMALLPALLAAAVTLAIVGAGRHGIGLGTAAAVGLGVLAVIALPVDFLRGRARRGTAGGGHHPSRAGRQRRH